MANFTRNWLQASRTLYNQLLSRKLTFSESTAFQNSHRIGTFFTNFLLPPTLQENHFFFNFQNSHNWSEIASGIDCHPLEDSTINRFARNLLFLNVLLFRFLFVDQCGNCSDLARKALKSKANPYKVVTKVKGTHTNH